VGYIRFLKATGHGLVDAGMRFRGFCAPSVVIWNEASGLAADDLS
jgi:hypothetical protein